MGENFMSRQLVQNNTYETRVIYRRRIPWSALAIWLTGVIVSALQGYQFGEKVAKDNGFDPSDAEQFVKRVKEVAKLFVNETQLGRFDEHYTAAFGRNQFVIMEFQFPFMVLFFGAAQVLPVAAIPLLSKIRVLKGLSKVDSFLLGCFNQFCGERFPRLF